MNTTKQKIAALQGKDAKTERAAKVVAGLITFILVFGFVAYFSKTLFLYVTSHHF